MKIFLSLSLLVASFSWASEKPEGAIQLIGPEGMIRTDRVRLGIYWHAAHTFYPAHRHNATELYHILSGTGFWQHKTQILMRTFTFLTAFVAWIFYGR